MWSGPESVCTEGDGQTNDTVGESSVRVYPVPYPDPRDLPDSEVTPPSSPLLLVHDGDRRIVGVE